MRAQSAPSARRVNLERPRTAPGQRRREAMRGQGGCTSSLYKPKQEQIPRGSFATNRAPPPARAFKTRRPKPTRFRQFYDRGDIPIMVSFSRAVRKIQWKVDINRIDVEYYLPLFFEGLREPEPYIFFAEQGTIELLNIAGNRILLCIPEIVKPIADNLATRDQRIVCSTLQMLKLLLLKCPLAAEKLVPFYRQILHICNLFITKRTNSGDSFAPTKGLLAAGQRRHEDISGVIMETLKLLERHGGEHAYVNIKYMCPTYESCNTGPIITRSGLIDFYERRGNTEALKRVDYLLTSYTSDELRKALLAKYGALPVELEP